MSSVKRSFSEDLKNVVTKLVINEGKSKREVGRLLNIPESSVRYIVKNFEEQGNNTTRKRGGNQPKKLTPEIQNTLTNLIQDNNHYTLSDIVDNLSIDVHPATVWKWLKALNFSWKITRPVPERRNDPEVKLERIPYVRWYQSQSVHLRYSNIIYISTKVRLTYT